MFNRVTVDRAVEILHDRGNAIHPRWSVGSGFLIGGRRVLTSAHNVGEGRLFVRADGRHLYSATLEKTGRAGTTSDLAVVGIDDAAFGRGPSSQIAFAAVDRTASGNVEGCWVVGFPRFKETLRSDVGPPWRPGVALRDTAHLQGEIPPGANRVQGLLELDVTATPRPMSSGALGSEWQGMSGAVVFASDPELGSVAVGVVTEHHRPEGQSALTVVPVTAVTHLDDAGEWWSVLGVVDPNRMPLLPAAPRVAPSPYTATLDELVRRTPVLLQREAELAELRSFATGSSGYRWVIGPPWSGKTALAAHLSRSLPPEVDVVAYFLVRRLGDADSSRYLSALNDQLDSLLSPQERSSSHDANRFRSLWARAVERARDAGRHLLLVVDGLDEDLGRPKGLASVASLLPTLVGEGAHVLVTSRPHPAIPGDVDMDHPLRGVAPVTLSPSPHAAALEARAGQELDALLQPSGGVDEPGVRRARQVLCLLAAAQGELSIDDLAELCAQEPFIIGNTLRSDVARVVQRLGPADTERFAFAHDTLRERSAAYFGRQRLLDDARLRILEWARRWAEEGWPAATTPAYLLDGYPDLLIEYGPEQLDELYKDLSYLETAIVRVGADQVAVTLRRIVAARSSGPTVVALQRHLWAQAKHLHPPNPIDQPGYPSRQLCLQALAEGDDDLVARARVRLAQLPPPRLLPRWTTSRPGQNLRQTPDLHDLRSRPGHRHAGWVTSVAVSLDGSWIVSGGIDHTVRRWNLRTGEPLGTLTSHGGGVTAVGVTRDGSWVVSGGWDGTVRAISLRELPRDQAASARTVGGPRHGDLVFGKPPVRPLGSHGGGVTSLAVTPDGTRVVSGGWDGSLRVWDLVSGEPALAPLGSHGGGVTSLAVTPDGTRVVSGGSDGSLRVWDLVSGEPALPPLGSHGGGVTSLAVTPDGTRVVSGGIDGTVRVWGLASGGPVNRALGSHDGGVTSVGVTAGGTLVISGGIDGTVRVWGLLGGFCLAQAALFAALGAVAVGNSDASAYVVTAESSGSMSLWML